MYLFDHGLKDKEFSGLYPNYILFASTLNFVVYPVMVNQN